jgi:uncharacterized protein YkwD
MSHCPWEEKRAGPEGARAEFGGFTLLHKPGRLVPYPVVLALSVLAATVALVAPAPRAAAAVGNCTPDAAWGTNNATFASQVVSLVNQHRQSLGLPTLGVSPTLTASAQWKSAHMAYYQYMQHDDPAPPVARTVSDRLAACGYPMTNIAWGENIAEGYQTPQDVMNAWLNSPGHKANIENASFVAIGVGAVQSSSGAWYWTQDFGSQLDSGSPPPPPPPPAPTLTLTSAPSASTTSTSASFAWTVSGATSVTCSLDSGTAAACSSPTSYSGLAVGTHRMVITAKNSAGASTATWVWTVTAPLAAAPTVTLTTVPAFYVKSKYSTFAWTTTGSPTSTTCSLDGGTAVACKSPTSYYKLASGRHTFVIQVANAFGSNTATYIWTR